MVLAVSCFYGQDTKIEEAKTVFSAKLYAVSNFQVGSPLIGNGVEITKSFSPSISWGKEYGNYNEVELTGIRFLKNARSKEMMFGSRYSYNWRLFNNSETNRFSYYIGAGVSANYSYGWSDYNEKNRNILIATSIIPRVNIKIGNRMYLDVNLPYNFYGHSFCKNESGFSNSSNFDKGNTDMAFPNKFTVNVGVAIKF